MTEIKVLRGQEALDYINYLVANDYVLTPDLRLIHLEKGSMLVHKTAALGPTQSTGFVQLSFTDSDASKLRQFKNPSLGKPFEEKDGTQQ